MIPFPESSFGKVVPSAAACRIVSSKRITPLMNFSAPAVANRISR